MTPRSDDDRWIARALGEPDADATSEDALTAAERAELASFEQTLAHVTAADALPREGSEPDPHLETRLRARLSARIEEEAARPGFLATLAKTLFSPRGLAGAATITAALLLAFLAGQRWSGSGAGDPAVRERVVLVALGDHFEKSERLLVEIANPATSGTPGVGQPRADRQRAEQLVADSRLLRASLGSSPESGSVAPLTELLEDLETILLEIANAPTQPTPSDWARLQRRIEKRGLLLRIEVIGDVSDFGLAPEPSPDLDDGNRI